MSSAILTIETMEKLIKFAKQIGVSRYDVTKINEPFIHLQAISAGQIFNIRISRVGVKHIIEQSPVEEDL